MPHYDNKIQGGETFELEEGNFTYNPKTLTHKGYTEGGSFTGELTEGDFVEINPNADRCVRKSASGIQIGFLDGDPDGDLPIESKTSGNYVKRIGNIALQGWELITIQLSSTNQQITPGTYLGIAADKKTMDKEEDTTTNIVAIQSAAANSGIKIEALQKGPAQAVAD